MDIKLLQRFVAVADEHSFSKAAEILAASQPVLTRSIHILEEDLGVPLFERGPRGVFLTPFGEELLPRARVLINEFNRTTSAIKALRQKQHLHVTIGVNASFASYIVPEAILALVELEPEIEVRVVESSFPSVLHRLREAELDLAFGTRDQSLDLTGLAFEPLVEERFVLVARPSHPVFTIDPLSHRDLIDLNWILPDDPEVIRSWRRVFEADNLLPPRLTVRTSSIALTKSCLIRADFISVAGYLSFHDELSSEKLKIVPLGSGRLLRPSGLFLRNTASSTPAGAALAASLRRVSQAFCEKLPTGLQTKVPRRLESSG